MSMFRVESGWIHDDRIGMPPAEARHLALVLRKKPGDLIRCRDTSGRVLSCRLLSVAPDTVTARIREFAGEKNEGQGTARCASGGTGLL